MIISCYSPTNASDETDPNVFYNELSSFRSIPKPYVLIIGGDVNAQVGKNVNNKFILHASTYRNGKHLTDFTQENRFTCLNAKSQKEREKFTYPNNAKAQLDFIPMNKKQNNSASNYEAYSSFCCIDTQ